MAIVADEARRPVTGAIVLDARLVALGHVQHQAVTHDDPDMAGQPRPRRKSAMSKATAGPETGSQSGDAVAPSTSAAISPRSSVVA